MIFKTLVLPLALFVVCVYCGDEEENYLIHLDDGDFEHKTQISTGMTTGDWFILMYLMLIKYHLYMDNVFTPFDQKQTVFFLNTKTLHGLPTLFDPILLCFL